VSVAQRDASLRERVDRGVAVDDDDVQIGPPGGECDRERAGAGADVGDDAVDGRSRSTASARHGRHRSSRTRRSEHDVVGARERARPAAGM